MTAQCRYIPAYTNGCKKPVVEGSEFCQEHLNKRCVVCQEQAVEECCHTGQFVCGAPLCKKCEGFTDLSKPNGAWGFGNHGHRRSLYCEPVRLDARNKPIVRVKLSTGK